MITLEKVESLLNSGEDEEVVEIMKTWHPTVLGRMLLAVDNAYGKRTNMLHPDFEKQRRKVAKGGNLQ